MTRIVSLAAVSSATVLAIALAATPALAKSKKHHSHHRGHIAAPYYGSYGAPFVSRNVSDPSFGSRAAYRNAVGGGGRCIANLGYGRYEYCGW
jgi:hypothetical protein